LLKLTSESGGKIIIFGNGGSASTASHFLCDFNKSLKYNAICLNDNVSIITAYANDIDFNDIFVEQIKTIYSKNDLIIGISTSGNSKNIINAFEYAKYLNIRTLSFTGYDGGQLKKISDYNINININDTQISEDLHLMLIHILFRILK
jgi:D-sedoheptulose 7-phosphate isomerase